MAGHAMINESADDGLTGEFWNQFVNSNEVDDVDENAVDVIHQRRAELAARNTERINRINAAWNCGRPSSSTSVPAQPTRAVPPRMPSQAPNLSPPTPEPTIPTRASSSSSASQASQWPGPSQRPAPSQRPVTEAAQPEREPEQLSSESNGTQAMVRSSKNKKRTLRGDDDDSSEDAELQESDKREKRRSRYHSRSRSPSTESRRRPRHRSRSRRRSRSRSRSRRYRSRSRSRSGSRDSRGRTRNRSDADRSGPSGELSMMQTMMTMMMQMIDKSSNQPAAANFSIPEAMSNRRAAAPSVPEPRATFARSGEEVDSSSTQTFGSTKTPSVTPAAYDVGTELFLKGDINFGEYLALKPSSREDRMVTPNPHVTSCINEAISILGRTEAKEQTGKFLYVPPTYESEVTKKDNRSPLIWNTHNVLFRFSSNLREVDLCEPFPNVNKKLKTVIADLGLDEGIIAHQLEESVKAAKARAALIDSSCQIQAIIAPPELPGPRGRRHMIERAVQTTGYACGECVERSKRTYTSVGVQTKTNIVRQADAVVQTSNFCREEEPRAPSITLTNMTPNQIELIETIVNYIRQRQITGSVESVSNALRRDSAAPVAMGREMYDSIQLTLGQAAGLANRASMNTRNIMPLQQPMPAAPPPPSVMLPMQAPKPNDPRLGGARAGNYRGFQGSRQQQQQVQLVPAGFAYEALKKNKKRK